MTPSVVVTRRDEHSHALKVGCRKLLTETICGILPTLKANRLVHTLLATTYYADAYIAQLHTLYFHVIAGASAEFGTHSCNSNTERRIPVELDHVAVSNGHPPPPPVRDVLLYAIWAICSALDSASETRGPMPVEC